MRKQRRKIGSFTPIWNQEMWIRPHFEMLARLQRNVVFLHERPFPQYEREHGYSITPDRSERLLRELFPRVEIYPSHYPQGKEFGADVYMEAMPFMQDCDIVFRLDPDMFFTEEVWDNFLQYIDDTDFDSYRMNFHNDSVNYYMTGDFDHGVKDAQEYDPLAFNPKYKLISPLVLVEGQWMQGQFLYPHGNETLIQFPGFFCHHFRGWNKPKSTPNPEWLTGMYAKGIPEQYGDWLHCPQEIRQKIQDWTRALEGGI